MGFLIISKNNWVSIDQILGFCSQELNEKDKKEREKRLQLTIGQQTCLQNSFHLLYHTGSFQDIACTYSRKKSDYNEEEKSENTLELKV